jgi:hypothetical protein
VSWDRISDPFAFADLVRQVPDLAAKERCQDNLLAFVEHHWSVVEPAVHLRKGYLLESICDHLQAVTDGYIRRLLINVPPGCTKSLLTDCFWPAWEWGPRNRPHERYLCVSYASHLTERDNERCLNVIRCDRYQKLWGGRFSLLTHSAGRVKFTNDKTGWKLASSVGGTVLGERGSRIILDDPNSTSDIESDATRYRTELFFSEVLPDRLGNLEEDAIVIIMQRLHERDVSGVALDR